MNSTFLSIDESKHCNKVVTALTPVHSRWYELGTHLNIPIGTLDSIADRHNNNQFRQMANVISTWIRRPTPDHWPSKRVLCLALADMGEVTMANRLSEAHKDDQSSKLTF